MIRVHTKNIMSKVCLMLWFVGLYTLPAQAAELKSTLNIRLVPSSGPAFELGQLHLTKTDTGYQYSVVMDDSKFGNYFLSMRPFKCFEHPKQMLCHLVYPYDKPNTFTADHLTNLEYDLLFIHRSASDYGIDPWNGLYYKLKLDGQRITGTLREADFNILASPPEKGVMYPIKGEDLHEAAVDSHAYPTLVIE